tara:strand:- start:834 stop:956 length:123 start_codon:yes stop_codon:yes gene_type:complete
MSATGERLIRPIDHSGDLIAFSISDDSFMSVCVGFIGLAG